MTIGLNRWAGWLAPALLALAGPAFGLVKAEEPADFVVIANPAAVIDAVRKEDLNALFLGNRDTLPGLEKTTPVAPDEASQIFESFARIIHGKSPADIKRHWARLIFSGAKIRPRHFKSEAELVAFVASNPTAIGFVSSGAADGRVKALRLAD